MRRRQPALGWVALLSCPWGNAPAAAAGAAAGGVLVLV
eukprot:gene36301-44575_t